MAGERWMNLAELFDWEAEDPIGLYPFTAKALAADFAPTKFPALTELGRPVVDFLFGRSSFVPRQLKAGMLTLYFPERWLSAKEKPYLMVSILDAHADYPIKYVHLITGEPIFISDFHHNMVRLWRLEDPNQVIGYKGVK